MIAHEIMEDFISDDLWIRVVCVDCKKAYQFQVSRTGYDKWVKGELIQRAMSEVPEDQRELLISGTCGECFDTLFIEDDGGGDDDLDEIAF